MAEIEYKGVKVGGSKLLLIIPLIGTLIGGLWGGFEVYQRYLLMEKKINSFVSPDLSDYDKRIELDIYYAENINFLIDIKIFIKTIIVILFPFGKGAL